MPMQQDRWYQSLDVLYLSSEPRLLSDLAAQLLDVGFIEYAGGEVLGYPRAEKVEIWQTEDIVSLTASYNGEEASFGHEGFKYWNKLELSYLLPWQPQENAAIFTEIVEKATEITGCNPTFQGVPYSRRAFLAVVSECASDLEHRMEKPGGEFLAQAISMDLPV